MVKKHDWIKNHTNQSRFYNPLHVRKFKSYITLNYFSIFNNTSTSSWVVHIRMDLLTCYSCFYYSSMVNDTQRENCFTQFSTWIYSNTKFWACKLFSMFIQAINFYYILISRLQEYRCLKIVIHRIDINKLLSLSAFQQI